MVFGLGQTRTNGIGRPGGNCLFWGLYLCLNNKSSNMTKWIIIGVIGVLVIMGFSSYNGLVTKEEGVGKAWGNVESD